MLVPRSKRYDDSDIMPRRLAVFRIETGSKLAASNKMSVVCSLTDEANPPITPARAAGAS